MGEQQMKEVTFKSHFELTEILMRRLIGLLYGISDIQELELEEDHQRVVDVLKGEKPIDENLITSLKRLKEADDNVRDPDDIISDIVLKVSAKKIFSRGAVIKGKRSEFGDVLELLCADWMKIDEIFAVELLSSLNSVVQRAMEIRGIFIEDEPPKKVRIYLTEATRCYIYGFYQACIALCRAAIEAVLELKLGEKGWNVSMISEDRKGEILCAMIYTAEEKGIIDGTMSRNADLIRKRGNYCLHQRRLFSGIKSLECIKYTRVILEYIYRDEKAEKK
jgi:hypothetical protein